MEKGTVPQEEHHDTHEHRHGRDDQEAVNRDGVEEALDMMAAEDKDDGVSTSRSPSLREKGDTEPIDLAPAKTTAP